MILLGVENKSELKGWIQKLEALNYKFSAFLEPDIGDQITAIAIAPTADPLVFKKLRLLS
jgi:hypothetical protein